MKTYRACLARIQTVVVAGLIALMAPVNVSGAGDTQSIKLSENLDRIVDDKQGKELVLRLVKFGLALNPGQLMKERYRRFNCSYGEALRSFMEHISCSRNGLLDYLADKGILSSSVSEGLGAEIFPFETVGQSFATRHPVTRGQLRNAMQALGPAQYNRELIIGVFQGKPLPDNSPGIRELNQFVMAYRSVRNIRAGDDSGIQAGGGEERSSGATELGDEMANAIRDAGLSIEEYNHISKLIEQYASLQRYIKERL